MTGWRMPKKSQALMETGERAISDKFRTTPIQSTITPIKGLPNSAILYKCEASSYWQFRVFLAGKARKRSTKEEDIKKAARAASLIYAQMLQAVHGEETKREPTSKKTLQLVAESLWAKNRVRIKTEGLHKDKVAKDSYVFERHIKPFFSRYDVKDIDAEALEEFKIYLAEKDLSAATQASYIQLVMSLLKQAQIKRYITHLPPKPKIRVVDEARGYFDDEELRKLQQAAYSSVGEVHSFKTADGKIYRKTKISDELYLVIRFMLNTFIRPTDLAVLKHKHVHKIVRNGIEFIELRHDTTKGHNNYMLGTEGALDSYLDVREWQKFYNKAAPDDFIFQPNSTNRESALENISTQFTALLEMTNLRTDSESKPRALYSMRHTAIVHAIRKGLPIPLIASNARTSVDMINRFYGSHVKSAANQGTVFVDTERAIRNKRYDKVNALAKEIGIEFDAYEPDQEGEVERRRSMVEFRDWERKQKKASIPDEVKKFLELNSMTKKGKDKP